MNVGEGVKQLVHDFHKNTCRMFLSFELGECDAVNVFKHNHIAYGLIVFFRNCAYNVWVVKLYCEVELFCQQVNIL